MEIPFHDYHGDHIIQHETLFGVVIYRRVLTATDNGPGLAADEREAVFERFARGAQAKPGAAASGSLWSARAAAPRAATPSLQHRRQAGFRSPPRGQRRVLQSAVSSFSTSPLPSRS